MKKYIILLLVFFIANNLNLKAQRGAIGFYVTANEYLGDRNPKKGDVFNFRSIQPGGAISFQQYLNSSFNLMEMVSYNRMEYKIPDSALGFRASIPTLNVMLRYKFNNGYIFKEDAFIAPFLLAGGGVAMITGREYNTTTNADGPYFLDKSGKEIKNLVVGNFAFGAGGFMRLSEKVGLEYSAIYNVPTNDRWDGEFGKKNDWYLQHSAGLVFSLGKATDTDKDGVSDKKDKCPNTPPGIQVDKTGCPIDTDEDGVADYLDKCPREAGTADMNGCPDTDKDGVSDFDDKCPAVPGLAKFAGCPDSDGDGVEDSKDQCPNTAAGTPVDANGCPLDSDGDKVPDNLDKCPNTPAGMTVDVNGCPADADADGVPDYLDKCPNTVAGTVVNENGCPRDTDNDGVPDNIDRCPNTPGPSTNRGCPEVKEEVKKRLKFATRGIFFEFAKADLKPESFPKLDEVIDIINQYPDYNLRLGGHTDAIGSNEANLKLSQARVDAVKSYIVGKGVPESRIDATGYGETKPIATNKTAVGRAQNRRVEMDLYLK